jgi:hypothetical protein
MADGSATRNLVIAGLACAALGGVGLLPAGQATPDAGDGYGPAAIVQRDAVAAGGTLGLVGPIGSTTVRNVAAAIDRFGGRVAAVSVRSLGGIDVAAVELARLFDTLGADLVLEDHAICASACVILVAAVSEGHRHLAPGSWLFVHPASRERSDSPEALSGSAVAQALGEVPNDPENSMARWVAKISPNWLSFLQGCPLQPLLQRGGLAMTWAEIEQVDKDPSSLDCARIAYRDVEWLRANMTSDLFLTPKSPE